MLFLLLAIISSAMVAIVMRFGSQHVEHRLGLLSMNYIVCTLLSALYAAPGGLFPAHEGLGVSLVIGTVSGLLYLVAFMMLQWNTQNNGVVLSSVFMKLGVLVPTAMSVLVFHESLGVLQTIGFILAIAAILVMNMQKDSSAVRSRLALIALLLCGGLTDSTFKVFEQLGAASLETQYLFHTFAVAMLLCIALMLWKHQRIGKHELLYGAVLGIPNFFSSKFLLHSLSSVPAAIAYPTFSVGTIVMVALFGVILFHEKLNRRQLIGITVIMAALALLNI